MTKWTCKECGSDEYSPFIYSLDSKGIKTHPEAPAGVELCQPCSYWLDLIGHKDDPDVVVAEGRFYVIHPDRPNDTGARLRMHGFYGSRFTFQKYTGEEITSNDVWNGSRIPDRFRDRLPDTAETVR